MADLDDFFAKRDKKKSTGKNKKFDTAEDLAKILGKRTEERKKLEGGKSQYVSEEGQSNLQVAQGKEDDEWIDAEEKKPDYTGLKIQELVLEDEEEFEAKEQEAREGGENATTERPWRKDPAKKSARAAEVEESKPDEESSNIENANEGSEIVVELEKPTAPTENSEEEKESSIAPATGGSKYVPPSLRNAPSSGPVSAANVNNKPPGPEREPPSADGLPKGAYVPPSRRGGPSSTTASAKSKKSSAAPNINDEQYFPSLGGS